LEFKWIFVNYNAKGISQHRNTDSERLFRIRNPSLFLKHLCSDGLFYLALYELQLQRNLSAVHRHKSSSQNLANML